MMFNPYLSSLEVQLYYQELLDEAEHERSCKALQEKRPHPFKHLLADLRHFFADMGHRLMGPPHAPVAR